MIEHEHPERPERMPGGPELSRHLGKMHGYHSSNDLEDFTVTHARLHAEEGRTITIEVTLRMELTPTEVWPDGDIPADWTPETVVDLVVEESRTLERFIRDWGADGGEVGVHAKGKYARGSLR